MFAIHFAAKLLRFCSDFARECFFAANFAVVFTPGDFVRRNFCKIAICERCFTYAIQKKMIQLNQVFNAHTAIIYFTVCV